MRKVSRLALASLSAMAMVLSGLGGVMASAEEADQLSFAEGTVLRMATGYNSTKTGLTFDAEVAGDGITLSNGQTYYAGDLKPTWVEIQNRLGFVIEDKYQGNSDANEFEYWKEQLDQVDMLNGTAAKLQEYGENGSIVDIAQYLDLMPNFKAYLDANPIVRLSITGNTTDGAIYFSPYFDGVDDIEKMFLMRVDWIAKLLDGEGEFTADACNNTAAPVYQPYMPTEGSIDIDVVTPDGTAVETIAKNYDAYGNIVAKMNEAGSISGVEAVNMLRAYIDATYDGYYGTERSALFCGQNAAWDADEVVALLRCVVANPQTLNGTDSVQGIFTREEQTAGRRMDMYRMAGHLFGVRGLESRNGFLFVGADGQLSDARQNLDTYQALARMNDLAKEGLISSAFINEEEVKIEQYLKDDLGFMEYDYNQTQTLYNEKEGIFDEGEKFMAVMVPVARWYDGTDENGVYMRFTESWRSVKTGGWAISKPGVGDDQNKLYAALKLIDYAYSPEGTILMSYGPDEFIKTNEDGSYSTFMFNGKEMPEIADTTYAELWEKAGGNYTNYARYYLGSTLSFMKSQAFEYQCTTEVGKEGAGYISKAIALGTIKHIILEVQPEGNWWYTVVPTTLPFTTVMNEMIGGFTGLNENFGNDNNALVEIVAKGFVREGLESPEAAVETVNGSWGGAQYLMLANQAWQDLLNYYNSIQ